MTPQEIVIKVLLGTSIEWRWEDMYFMVNDPYPYVVKRNVVKALIESQDENERKAAQLIITEVYKGSIALT